MAASSLRAPPQGSLGVWLCTTETGKPASSLTLNKRLQRPFDHGRFLGDARVFPCFCEQFVIDHDRCSHQDNSKH